MVLTDGYIALNVEQLLILLEDVNDKEQEIRIWVEELNNEGTSYLQARKLCGVVDDPNDKYCCLVAKHYEEGDLE